jgi:hypothetical protein
MQDMYESVVLNHKDYSVVTICDIQHYLAIFNSLLQMTNISIRRYLALNILNDLEFSSLGMS